MNYIRENIIQIVAVIIFSTLVFLGIKNIFFKRKSRDKRLSYLNKNLGTIKQDMSLKKIKKLGKHVPIIRYITEKYDTELQRKQDNELQSIIIQLQNISVTKQDVTLTYMLTRVIRFSKHTKKAFIEYIKYLDLNQLKKAKEEFTNQINTPLARDFVQIIENIDNLSPKEITNELSVLEQRVENDNITIKNQKAELYSDLMYLLPTVLCFVILMNFLKIVLNIIVNFTI